MVVLQQPRLFLCLRQSPGRDVDKLLSPVCVNATIPDSGGWGCVCRELGVGCVRPSSVNAARLSPITASMPERFPCLWGRFVLILTWISFVVSQPCSDGDIRLVRLATG